MAALQGFGVPSELVEEQRRKAQATKQEEGFEVFEDNWFAVQVFRALQTQWNRVIVASGEKATMIYEGIRYEAFPTAMTVAGAPLARRQEIYMAVQLMEYHALKVLNQRATNGG